MIGAAVIRHPPYRLNRVPNSIVTFGPICSLEGTEFMGTTASRFIGAAFVVVLGVSGCAGGDADAAKSQKGAEKAGAPAAKAMDGTIQALPDMGKEAQGIVKDIKIKQCPLEPGKHHVTGTAKNTNAQNRDVLTAYTWLAADSTDALARGVATFKDMKAGDEKEWSMDVELKSKASRCVPYAKSAKVGTLK
jgi:hypothetical protein